MDLTYLKGRTMKLQDQTNKSNVKTKRLYDQLFQNYALFFLLATFLNLFLSLFVIPSLLSSDPFLFLGSALISYGLSIPLFFLSIRKEISYLKTLLEKTNSLANGNHQVAFPIQGQTDLSQFAKDITLIHNQLDRQIQSVAQAKLENQQLVTAISNELYPTNSTLIGYLERMEKVNHPDPEKRYHYLTTAIKKSYVIKAFIEKTLNYAFSDKAGSFYEFKIYKGKELIRHLIEKIIPILEEAEFEVILEDCLNQDFSLWVDFQQLQHVFDELTANMIKFSDPEKPIHLGLILNKNELFFILRNKTLDALGGELNSESPTLDFCKKVILRHQGRIDYYQLKQMFKVEVVLPIHSPS